MKITQIELILTHSPGKNAPSQVELFSVFYFESGFHTKTENHPR